MFLLSFLVNVTYRSVAVVLPPERSSNALAMMGSSGGGSSMASAGALAALGMKSPADLYVALMGSQSVEDALIREFDLQSLYKTRTMTDTRKVLEQHTQITADSKSGLISIAVVDRDPQRAAAMSNAIVRLYDKVSARLAITDAQRRRMFLEQQVDKTKTDLAQSEDAMKTMSARTGMLQPEGDVRALIGFESTLRAQIAVKTARLNAQRGYLSPDNPEIQGAERELAGLQAQIADVEKKQNGGSDLTSRTGQSEASLEYIRRYRAVKYNETVLELLLKSLELARLDEAQEGTVMQVVDPGQVPDAKWSPHRSFFLAGGLFAGVLFALLWSVYRDLPELSEAGSVA